MKEKKGNWESHLALLRKCFDDEWRGNRTHPTLQSQVEKGPEMKQRNKDHHLNISLDLEERGHKSVTKDGQLTASSASFLPTTQPYENGIFAPFYPTLSPLSFHTLAPIHLPNSYTILQDVAVQNIPWHPKLGWFPLLGIPLGPHHSIQHMYSSF